MEDYNSTTSALSLHTLFLAKVLNCETPFPIPDGEVEDWLPAKWLRRILGVVDFQAGQFVTAAGEILAFTIKESGESWEGYQFEMLVARRDIVIDALRARNLALACGIQLYREPSYPLIMLSDEKRMYQDWCATVLFTDDSLKTVIFKDLIARWGNNA